MWKNIANNVSRGEPKWPAGVALPDNLKLRLRNGYDPLSDHTTEFISLKSLSASLDNYIRCFSYMLLAYEEEHRIHSLFDVNSFHYPGYLVLH